MDKICEDIIKKHGKELSKKKNFAGWSGSLQYKIKNGRTYERKKSFRVYVTVKEDLDKLSVKDIIPDSFKIDDGLDDEIDVDIIAIGVIRSLQKQGNQFSNPFTKDEIKALEVCRDRNRPIKSGCSAMNYQGSGCTLGWYAKNKKEGEDVFIGIIANNHCCSRENKASRGEPYLYPSPIDGGTINDKVAEHWRHVDISFNGFNCAYRDLFHKIYRKFSKSAINEVDVGLEHITIPLWEVSMEVFKIGKIMGKRRGEIGELSHKTGRTTGYTKEAKLIDNDWFGSVQYSRGIAQFGPCLLLHGDNFSADGDSSSALVWMKDNYIAGLLFAGSSTHTVGCHWDRIEELLDVEIIVDNN